MVVATPSSSGPQSEAEALHQQVVEACRLAAEADVKLAKLLNEVFTTGAHKRLGFNLKRDYCESLGLAPRKAQALVQLARRFDELPGLEQALRDGVGWTKLRSLVTVAVPETIESWLQLAASRPRAEVEAAVACSDVGELPPPLGEVRRPVRGRFVLEDVDTGFIELIQRALQKARHLSGLTGDDFDPGAALAMICQRFLVEPDVDPNNPSPSLPGHMMVVQVCPECGAIDGCTRHIDDTGATVALDDCVVVDVAQTEKSARLEARIRGREPGDASQREPGFASGAPAVRRSIPQHRRIQVLTRDAFTCRVPGCSCSYYVQLHHIRHVEVGGDNASSNLVTLCPLHHRMHHAGRLGISGDADAIVVFDLPNRPSVGVGPPC